MNRLKYLLYVPLAILTVIGGVAMIVAAALNTITEICELIGERIDPSN